MKRIGRRIEEILYGGLSHIKIACGQNFLLRYCKGCCKISMTEKSQCLVCMTWTLQQKERDLKQN